MEHKMIEYNKVNQVVLTYNKRFIVVGLIVLMLFVSSIGMLYLSYSVISAPDKPPEGSKEKRLEYFRETFRKYETMTEDTIHAKWRQLFKNCKYEKNGNYQQNKVDCSGAMYILYRQLGSNILSQQVEKYEKRLREIAYDYPEIIRRSKKSIKPKDWILFKYKNGTRHCGIVYAVKKNIIQYFDFNIRTGEAQKEIWWKDKRITTIAKLPFAFWVGDLLK